MRLDSNLRRRSDFVGGARIPDMIVAIVVTYQPHLFELARLLDAIRHQVQRTIVVDNGSTTNVNGFLADRNDPGVQCLCFDNNHSVPAELKS